LIFDLFEKCNLVPDILADLGIGVPRRMGGACGLLTPSKKLTKVPRSF
jgi:hypothetical protein